MGTHKVHDTDDVCCTMPGEHGGAWGSPHKLCWSPSPWGNTFSKGTSKYQTPWLIRRAEKRPGPSSSQISAHWRRIQARKGDGRTLSSGGRWCHGVEESKSGPCIPLKPEMWDIVLKQGFKMKSLVPFAPDEEFKVRQPRRNPKGQCPL